MTPSYEEANAGTNKQRKKLSFYLSLFLLEFFFIDGLNSNKKKSLLKLTLQTGSVFFILKACKNEIYVKFLIIINNATKIGNFNYYWSVQINYVKSSP